MESDLEGMLRELNGLELDPQMPHQDYMSNCERLEEIAEEIAESPYGRKYEILRNLMCSYDGQEFPTGAVIEASLKTEKNVDFLKEIIDHYTEGEAFETITIGDTELDTPGQVMTDFVRETILDYLELMDNGVIEEYYTDKDDVEDAEVLDRVADGIIDNIFDGNYEDVAKDLDEVYASPKRKSLPAPLSETVCDAKIEFHDVLPKNVLDAINDETSLENIYETACNDLFFYGSIGDMPSEIKARNAKILYHGAMKEREHFYPVFEEVAREMHYEFDAHDFGESFGLLLDEIMRYRD